MKFVLQIETAKKGVGDSATSAIVVTTWYFKNLFTATLIKYIEQPSDASTNISHMNLRMLDLLLTILSTPCALEVTIE
jgi:hypothetical protein